MTLVKRPKKTRTGQERQTDPRGLTRGEKFRVKTARRRKTSSTRWLQRQLNDPYVAAAQRDGYRSRAAYKLLELDDKFDFIRHCHAVIDLGAAPGGWTQILLKKRENKVKVVGIDLLEIDTIAGAEFVQMDFTTAGADKVLMDKLGCQADLVMSDMAAATTGHQSTDHLRTLALVEEAYYFAKDVLVKRGCFVAKVFRGGADQKLLEDMRLNFEKVRHFKPPASRTGSAETYLVAQNYIGKNNSDCIED